MNRIEELILDRVGSRYTDLRDRQAPQAGTVRTMFHII